jgi:2-keto-4-pentenoate hydratase/2-oxohepta-3-ene-1,7-dioic acid hydratase in catechol pathway
MSRYQHTDVTGKLIDLPVGKAVCVGRNYMQHIQELNNPVPTQPILFIKPVEALVNIQPNISIPKDKGECHNELELAVLLEKPLKNCSIENAKNAIWGIGLGLDLTLRDVQSQLKSKGHPWERAKAFDGSCPLSPFVPMQNFSDFTNIEFNLQVNGEFRQLGNSKDMLVSILDLLVHISEQFTLSPGDIVMTGTPKGVAALNTGDKLNVTLPPFLTLTSEVL